MRSRAEDAPSVRNDRLIEGGSVSQERHDRVWLAFCPVLYVCGRSLVFGVPLSLVAKVGRERLVHRCPVPHRHVRPADPFTATLDAGTYAAEWFGVDIRETVGAGEVTVESSTPISFSAPFEAAGPAVLYLKRV